MEWKSEIFWRVFFLLIQAVFYLNATHSPNLSIELRSGAAFHAYKLCIPTFDLEAAL